MSATITISTVPPKACWPNARTHWRAKARVVASFREVAGWSTKLAVLADPWRFDWVYRARVIVLDVVIAWPKGQRRLDDDNAWASLKAARDGIAEVLQVNDRRFRQGALAQTHGDGSITVTLREE